MRSCAHTESFAPEIEAKSRRKKDLTFGRSWQNSEKSAVPLYRCTAVPLNNDTLASPTTRRETGLDVKNGIWSITALKNMRGIMPIIFYVKYFF